jgi:hypothetical protein
MLSISASNNYKSHTTNRKDNIMSRRKKTSEEKMKEKLVILLTIKDKERIFAFCDSQNIEVSSFVRSLIFERIDSESINTVPENLH